MSNTIEKTPQERKEIKLMKSLHKEKLHGVFFTPYERYKSRLIVYTKYSKVEGYRSTHSFVCFKSEVNTHLQELKDAGYIINKAYFNGKPYYE